MIELLVAMSIIAVLVGMLAPMIGVVRRSTERTSTQVVLKKVDTALRMFKTDWQVYPGQMSYAAAAGDHGNRLGYSIGSDLDTTQRSAILGDATSAAAQYNYACTGGGSPVESGTQPSTLTYRSSDIVNEPNLYNSGYYTCYAALVNRMAREQVRLAAVSGNLWLRGAVVSNTDTSIVANRLATSVFSTPASGSYANGPGWAHDYLAGELEKRYRDGNAILDAWKRPLTYVCQVVPGVSGATAIIYTQYVTIANSRRYGLGAIGFDPSQGPGPALATTRPWLLYSGRIALVASDAGDGKPLPADATYLPDPANLLHSDMRYYAAARFVREFELWSSGPDKSIEYMRDARVNTDNISVVPYNGGL